MDGKGFFGIAAALVVGLAAGFFGPSLIKKVKDSKKIKEIIEPITEEKLSL